MSSLFVDSTGEASWKTPQPQVLEDQGSRPSFWCVYGVQEGCQLEVEEEYPGIDPTVAVHQL
jgi:hypothetical protein